MKLNKAMIALLVCAAGMSYAQEENPFVTALKQGQAQDAFAQPKFANVISQLKKQTGNDGAIVLKARRLLWFKNQSRCGRIQFWVEQPATNTRWNEVGGDLNICEDGQPPWQICSDQKLVPYGSKCSDGKLATDTAEISAAIQESLKRGSLTMDQAKQKSMKGKP